MAETKEAKRVRSILAEVKSLAGEYYILTGKPLGVTGEVAEYIAAETLGMELAPPRTKGFDAIRKSMDGDQRIQIKGRACNGPAKPNQKLGKIDSDSPCDAVLLVILDNTTFEAHQIWEAPMIAVAERLKVPGSKARRRGVLSVGEFQKLATQIWARP
jgi:hypothetical protein